MILSARSLLVSLARWAPPLSVTMLLSSSLLSTMSTSFSGSACLSGWGLGGKPRSGSSCSTCASSAGFGRASAC
eukprot:77586-Alexandrium_andersonii.AAC.1